MRDNNNTGVSATEVRAIMLLLASFLMLASGMVVIVDVSGGGIQKYCPPEIPTATPAKSPSSALPELASQ